MKIDGITIVERNNKHDEVCCAAINYQKCCKKKLVSHYLDYNLDYKRTKKEISRDPNQTDYERVTYL
jgi:hypothetical protein